MSVASHYVSERGGRFRVVAAVFYLNSPRPYLRQCEETRTAATETDLKRKWPFLNCTEWRSSLVYRLHVFSCGNTNQKTIFHCVFCTIVSVRLSLLVRCVYTNQKTIFHCVFCTIVSVRLSLLVRCVYTNHKTIFHCVFCTIVSVRLSLLVRCVYTNQKTIFHCVFCTIVSVRLSLLVRCVYTNHKTIFHCVFCTIVSACSLCIYQP